MNTLYRSFLLVGALASPLAAHAFSLPWLTKAPSAQAPAAAPDKRSESDAQFADRIVVKKGERRLYLMRGNAPIRTYKVALGYQPTGNKRYQGDGRTPEGRYFIDQRNERSKYRKALRISYPSPTDRLRARSAGYEPGGLIMIHGQPNEAPERRNGDWTFGCIAVTNMEIDEIWNLTTQGTPVEILP
jgi:murein L,D-transpeptidase YafK